MHCAMGTERDFFLPYTIFSDSETKKKIRQKRRNKSDILCYKAAGFKKLEVG